MTSESVSERLLRVLSKALPPASERKQEERFLKAKELFRLGISLRLQENLTDGLMGLTEGYLLADAAAPDVLVQYVHNQKHNGSLLSYIVETTAGKTSSVDDEIRLGFLKMRWLDVKLKSEHELHAQNQYPDDAAIKGWFETAERFVAYGKYLIEKYPSADRRLISRITLDIGKNVYKQNPPDKELIEKAIDLWPEDYIARSWGGRHEDLSALVGEGDGEALLERDSKYYGKSCYELAWTLKDENAKLSETYLKRGLDWE
eukprot:CAMPEP_0197688810 /NCGR_PEP_ID=MMETSP1338-20131121/105994_1 /TAXON_ID=43686 ORGANISM="Pelagodinium beii, Strain RCC1491" /NCGR_SAMPLE_ID=MMETSP1338 /ASSEMBLY_ACC=CAM_ASM_000754 /LENGTH=259 /DNA_ID=CAMNT_0043271071 /DNA_START=192 /DNA_END=968 /DNA_ORIENTATION=-